MTTGLAIGTKFPVVPLLVAVLAVGASTLSPYRVRDQLARAFALGLTAIVTFLVTTPAALLEPFKFLELAQYISNRYQHGHYGYTVGLGWDHVYHVLLYFAVNYFSPYLWVSVALSLCVPAGVVVWWRTDRRIALLLVGFALAFLFFFCFHYAAVQVRNYLLLGPFFGLLAARALGALVDWLPHVALRVAVWVALGCAGIANGAFLVRAAESIQHQSVEDDVRQALAYIAARPDSRFRLSSGVQDIASRAHLRVPPNAKGRRFEHVVFFVPSEGPFAFDWRGNDPFAFEQIFGPKEVNIEWYPTWWGSPHLGVMTLDKARGIGVPWLPR